eukprot:2945215-Karenia_brevis.AAC.1
MAALKLFDYGSSVAEMAALTLCFLYLLAKMIAQRNFFLSVICSLEHDAFLLAICFWLANALCF